MNCYVSSLGGRFNSGLDISPYFVFRKTTEMGRPGPSRTWVLIDEREDSINNGFFALTQTGIDPPQPTTYIWYNWPASYHAGSSALSFADGHAEVHRWVDPRTKRKIGSQLDPQAGVGSPNNRDVGWLLERSTARK